MKNKSLYPITVDSVIFGYAQGDLKIALIERKVEPFKGMWAIPGGFMEGEETVEETALRELKEETGLENIFLEQFHVFSSHGRDPRGRTITVAFFALIDSDNYELVASSDALRAKWWSTSELPPLAFHQKIIYDRAVESLRIAMKTRPIAFELLPKKFKLTDLQNLYELIFDIKIDKRNFRRKVANMSFIRSSGKKLLGQKHRPAMLYEFSPKLYKEFLSENIFSF